MKVFSKLTLALVPLVLATASPSGATSRSTTGNPGTNTGMGTVTPSDPRQNTNQLNQDGTSNPAGTQRGSVRYPASDDQRDARARAESQTDTTTRGTQDSRETPQGTDQGTGTTNR